MLARFTLKSDKGFYVRKEYFMEKVKEDSSLVKFRNQTSKLSILVTYENYLFKDCPKCFQIAWASWK